VAVPLQYPVSHGRSLEALWYPGALLTLCSRHVLWDAWCSSCSVLQPYLQDQILSMNETIAKLSLVPPGSCPRNVSSTVGKQAEVGQGSVCLEAGELLVAQKAPV